MNLSDTAQTVSGKKRYINHAELLARIKENACLNAIGIKSLAVNLPAGERIETRKAILRAKEQVGLQMKQELDYKNPNNLILRSNIGSSTSYDLLH